MPLGLEKIRINLRWIPCVRLQRLSSVFLSSLCCCYCFFGVCRFFLLRFFLIHANSKIILCLIHNDSSPTYAGNAPSSFINRKRVRYPRNASFPQTARGNAQILSSHHCQRLRNKAQQVRTLYYGRHHPILPIIQQSRVFMLLHDLQKPFFFKQLCLTQERSCYNVCVCCACVCDSTVATQLNRT